MQISNSARPKLIRPSFSFSSSALSFGHFHTLFYFFFLHPSILRTKSLSYLLFPVNYSLASCRQVEGMSAPLSLSQRHRAARIRVIMIIVVWCFLKNNGNDMNYELVKENLRARQHQTTEALPIPPLLFSSPSLPKYVGIHVCYVATLPPSLLCLPAQIEEHLARPPPSVRSIP